MGGVIKVRAGKGHEGVGRLVAGPTPISEWVRLIRDREAGGRGHERLVGRPHPLIRVLWPQGAS